MSAMTLEFISSMARSSMFTIPDGAILHPFGAKNQIPGHTHEQRMKRAINRSRYFT